MTPGGPSTGRAHSRDHPTDGAGNATEGLR
jgi:hypothetical protein